MNRDLRNRLELAAQGALAIVGAALILAGLLGVGSMLEHLLTGGL